MDAYQKLAEAIGEVVNDTDGQTWQDRLKKVITACENEGTASELVEFASWCENLEQMLEGE